MRKFKDDKVDWKKLFDKLENPLVANGEEYIDVTPCEEKALDELAAFVGKMNPPEDDRIPLEARKENDIKFREFVNSQFNYLER